MADEIIIEYFPTSFGELILGSFHGALCLCDWQYRSSRNKIDDRIRMGLKTGFKLGTSLLHGQIKNQLTQYFSGDRTLFEIPLLMVGTSFQKSVWNALLDIPYGETVTYFEVACKLGDDKATRAVAAANGANALSIIVPCHRVIAADGKLTGYAGGIAIKKRLLQIENALDPNQLLLF